MRNITFKIIMLYLKEKMLTIKKNRPYLCAEGRRISFSFSLPLDAVFWGGYIFYFIWTIYSSWRNVWSPEPVFKALTIGGWFLSFYLLCIAAYLAYYIWRDLLNERRNEYTAMSFNEIKCRQIDFER